MSKTISHIMVPLNRYSVVPPYATLAHVVSNLKNAYCDSRTKFCKKAGARAIFVVDDNGKLMGMVDLHAVLKALVPEIAGRLGEKLRIQAVSVAFAEAASMSQDETKAGLLARVKRSAEMPVSKIMQPIGASLQVDSTILEAARLFQIHDVEAIPVYEGKKLVGIVREKDVFIAITTILT